MSSSWPKETKKKLDGAGPTENEKTMMERSDGVDHDHPPLPHDMKGVSTVPIGGEVGPDLAPVLAATV